MKGLFCFLIAMALVGCAAVEGVLSKNTLAAQLLVQEATARAIEAVKEPAGQVVRAHKIAAITAGIKQSFDTTAMALPDLVQLAAVRVAALKLGPADAIIAQALIDSLAQEVQSKVCPASIATTPCTIPADKTFWVDQVLGWVTATTALYRG